MREKAKFRKGQVVRVYPSGNRVRIVSVIRHEGKEEALVAGEAFGTAGDPIAKSEARP